MYAKFEITGVINVITGMHIGEATQFSAIGSVDAPVIRDALTGLPIIPGSSLKGKMRYLLARKLNEYPDDDYDDYNHNDDHVLILRLFGSSKKGEIRKSRLLFSDTILNNAEELRRRGALSPTEIKIENSIHRMKAEANPRQIERVIRGSSFDLHIIYEAENEEEILEDIHLVKEGLKLLEFDYIGGHGSRGYGKIQFENLDINLVMGEVNPAIVEDCKKVLKGV